jgi:hypothetical protein
VASGMGAAQHALSGRQGALARGVDKQDLSRLRKAAMASVPKDTSPFYERAWFLALCLAAVFAVGAWSLWPKSEAALYAHAKPLMDSVLVTDWRGAQDDVAELLERFPDTTHRAEIEEFQFRYAIHSAEERIKNIDRFGAEPETEADRQYYAARRDEQLGDRLSAWNKYDALVKLFGDSKNLEERAVAALAERRVAEIRTKARDEQDVDQLQTVVQGKLDQAAALVRQKQLLRAREVLESIVDLYDGNREVAPLVEEARTRIRELHAPGGGGDEGE